MILLYLKNFKEVGGLHVNLARRILVAQIKDANSGKFRWNAAHELAHNFFSISSHLQEAYTRLTKDGG